MDTPTAGNREPEGLHHFAAVGDVHGHMLAMVRLLARWEQQHRARLQFVLQVGDFEPHRHQADLATMAAPRKYRKLGDFPAFHRGEAAFPWPVYFIGGNHEPYGFLDQVPEGGTIAENCHYLGRVGRVELCHLRIVGLSGIYHPGGFVTPRPGIARLNETSNKAYTCFLESEVEQALAYGKADVLLLHDWPAGLIEQPVPNEYAWLLVEGLRPRLVLCGHMHARHGQRLSLPGNGVAEFCGLGSVEQGSAALAVFRIERDGVLTEVTAGQG